LVGLGSGHRCDHDGGLRLAVRGYYPFECGEGAELRYDFSASVPTTWVWRYSFSAERWHPYGGGGASLAIGGLGSWGISASGFAGTAWLTGDGAGVVSQGGSFISADASVGQADGLYDSTEARVWFSTAIAVMGDAAPIALGPVANPGSIDINTFGSDFDTAIGLYSPNGELIAWNDDSGSPQSSITPDLGAGAYSLLVGGSGTVYGAGFPVEPVQGTPGGQIAGSIAGHQFGPISVDPGQVRLLRFRISQEPSSEDLGVVGGPGPTAIEITSTGDELGEVVLYDGIGRIIASGVPMAPDLDAGRYHLGVGGLGAVFQEAFRVSAPDGLNSEGPFNGSVGGTPFEGYLYSWTDEVPFYSFTVAAVAATPPISPSRSACSTWRT
jgi:hypothetical protein